MGYIGTKEVILKNMGKNKKNIVEITTNVRNYGKPKCRNLGFILKFHIVPAVFFQLLRLSCHCYVPTLTLNETT